MTSLHGVINAGKDHDTGELDNISIFHETGSRKSTYNDNVPVERYCRQLMWRLREEVHDKAQNHEQDGDDIDWQTPSTQTPASGQQRLSTKPFEDDTTDGDDVGAEQCSSAERSDDVERDFTTQVDERE